MLPRRIIFLLLVAGMTACSKSAPPPLKVSQGQQLSPFHLKDMNEKSAIVDVATGKLLIINLWATWCGPCRHELPSLDRLGKILEPEARVIGISSDTDSHVLREFLIERKVGFTSYWDPDQRVINDIVGVRVFPSTLFVGPDGKLVKVVEGWRQWDTPQMVEEIRGLIKAS